MTEDWVWTWLGTTDPRLVSYACILVPQQQKIFECKSVHVIRLLGGHPTSLYTEENKMKTTGERRIETRGPGPDALIALASQKIHNNTKLLA